MHKPHFKKRSLPFSLHNTAGKCGRCLFFRILFWKCLSTLSIGKLFLGPLTHDWWKVGNQQKIDLKEHKSKSFVTSTLEDTSLFGTERHHVRLLGA